MADAAQSDDVDIEWLKMLEKTTLVAGPPAKIDLQFDQKSMGEYTKTKQKYFPVLVHGDITELVGTGGAAETVPAEADGAAETVPAEANGDSDSEMSQGDTQEMGGGKSALKKPRTGDLGCPWHALSRLMDIALHHLLPLENVGGRRLAGPALGDALEVLVEQRQPRRLHGP
jgi:hypothetical protein